MWPFLVFGIFGVIPALSYLLSRFWPLVVFRFSLGLIILGFLAILLVVAASSLALPIITNAILWVGCGFLSIFSGMGALVGFGLWKVIHRA
jgi:hypothetical protein